MRTSIGEGHVRLSTHDKATEMTHPTVDGEEAEDVEASMEAQVTEQERIQLMEDSEVIGQTSAVRRVRSLKGTVSRDF
jgi:hypothetical protein